MKIQKVTCIVVLFSGVMLSAYGGVKLIEVVDAKNQAIEISSLFGSVGGGLMESLGIERLLEEGKRKAIMLIVGGGITTLLATTFLCVQYEARNN
ncbi:hypothetical protein BCU68_10860 [Vibrio sp. 10N.286.49.B3]|uniref:hypothetical protein n=1 Tax=Vibrio sp. 10N.286.49.B3 TaxID=1880855 RepID=UPI000C8164E0|nr:hypothetical protein [Vibrio sp. 10N.286.49.B3]PMH45356.1 hypothetical protein BCU68_10860 [Vibrio sp. 10N.286.49.B3]